MGQTLTKLAERDLTGKPIFPNRFVVECCEVFHTHFKNLRIVLSTTDFIKVAEGFASALSRWQKQGSPEPAQGTHIELTRKEVADANDNRILINLNRNLYLPNEGRVFAEGAEFKDEQYIHLKVRDLRWECSIEEFMILASAIQEAKTRLVGIQDATRV